jgi:hypothetical protein
MFNKDQKRVYDIEYRRINQDRIRKKRQEYRTKNKAKKATYDKNHKKSYKERRKSITNNHRAWLDEFKATRGCDICSERHPACLDFHHLDPDTKYKKVSRLIYCRRRLLVEIGKCELLCANCHRKRHIKSSAPPELHSELKIQHADATSLCDAQ